MRCNPSNASASLRCRQAWQRPAQPHTTRVARGLHTIESFLNDGLSSSPALLQTADPAGGNVLRGSAAPVTKATRPSSSRVTRRSSAVAIAPAIARGYARYVKAAQRFPGVEESTAYGTPALKVKGKILSRWRTEAEGALALYCDFIDRQILLQADPEVFFLTDHYRDYPMVLVRLDKVRSAALPELIERAWRMRASKKLLQQFATTAAR
jgi:hypothetical protein